MLVSGYIVCFILSLYFTMLHDGGQVLPKISLSGQLIKFKIALLHIYI